MDPEPRSAPRSCLRKSARWTGLGIEVHSLKVEGRYLDEVLMVKFLR